MCLLSFQFGLLDRVVDGWRLFSVSTRRPNDTLGSRPVVWSASDVEITALQPDRMQLPVNVGVAVVRGRHDRAERRQLQAAVCLGRTVWKHLDRRPSWLSMSSAAPCRQFSSTTRRSDTNSTSSTCCAFALEQVVQVSVPVIECRKPVSI